MALGPGIAQQRSMSNVEGRCIAQPEHGKEVGRTGGHRAVEVFGKKVAAAARLWYRKTVVGLHVLDTPGGSGTSPAHELTMLRTRRYLAGEKTSTMALRFLPTTYIERDE